PSESARNQGQNRRGRSPPPAAGGARALPAICLRTSTNECVPPTLTASGRDGASRRGRRESVRRQTYPNHAVREDSLRPSTGHMSAIRSRERHRASPPTHGWREGDRPVATLLSTPFDEWRRTSGAAVGRGFHGPRKWAAACGLINSIKSGSRMMPTEGLASCHELLRDSG